MSIKEGLENFPKHVVEDVEALFGGDKTAVATGILGDILSSGPVSELIAFEKANGPEQLDQAKEDGIVAYKAERAKGASVGLSIVAGVKAAFEAEVANVKSELKTLTTPAMTTLISLVTGNAPTDS